MQRQSFSFVWILACILSATSFGAWATDFGIYGQGNKSDSGIFGRPYVQIVQELDQLASQYPAYVDKVQYGTTIGGRPLSAIKIYKKSVTNGTQGKVILIAGSIHGNEFLNIEDRLPRWFLEQGLNRPEVQTFLNQGGVLLIAPILNPDGYEDRARANRNKKDLNRDFTVRRKNHFAFKEPETKALSEWISDEMQANGKRLAVTMDYHCCIGAILRPWSFKTSKPPALDMARFDTVGQILKQSFGNDYKYGTTPNILGYSAVGTSKDYYYETYGAVALTFEGKYKKEDQRFDKHTQMWLKILDATNQGML